MSFLLKRKQIVLGTLVVALCAAIFVNWYYTSGNQNLTESAGKETTTETKNLGEAQYVDSSTELSKEVSLLSNGYFSQAKLKRTNTYDEAKETLMAVIENKNSNSEAVSTATTSLTSLTTKNTLETDIENLITGKLNSECLVVLGENNIEILLSEKVVNDTSVLQIKEIILSKTNILGENITIVGVK